MKSRIYPKLALFLAIVFIIRFYLSTLQFNRDMVNHMVWSKSMIEEGLKGLYLRNQLSTPGKSIIFSFT